MKSEKDMIMKSLTQDDEAFLRDLEDGRGLFTQISATFHGPMRFWTALGAVSVFVATALGLFTVWQLFHADTTRSLILWAGGAWAAWTAQIALKQWLFDRMNHMTVLRELKKIELRVAKLERE